MIALGIGALGWYYTETFSRQNRARQLAQTPRAAAHKAICVCRPWARSTRLDRRRCRRLRNRLYPNRRRRSPKQHNLMASERRVSRRRRCECADAGKNPCGSAIGTETRRLRLRAAVHGERRGHSPEIDGAAPPSWVAAPRTTGVPNGELTALMRATDMTAVRAQVLPTLRLLLPKGAFIDCTLETAIDSSLPGLTTCITATDTFGADGKVVLLERGTKLDRRDSRPGAARHGARVRALDRGAYAAGRRRTARIAGDR